MSVFFLLLNGQRIVTSSIVELCISTVAGKTRCQAVLRCCLRLPPQEQRGDQEYHGASPQRTSYRREMRRSFKFAIDTCLCKTIPPSRCGGLFWRGRIRLRIGPLQLVLFRSLAQHLKRLPIEGQRVPAKQGIRLQHALQRLSAGPGFARR
jgi:hypothetical protein